MKFLFLVLTLFSLSSFADEDQKNNQNNELSKNKQKVFEEKCTKFAVQSKVPEKRLSVFMAECMASLSLGNIDEGEESISTNEKPDSSMKKPK